MALTEIDAAVTEPVVRLAGRAQQPVVGDLGIESIGGCPEQESHEATGRVRRAIVIGIPSTKGDRRSLMMLTAT